MECIVFSCELSLRFREKAGKVLQCVFLLLVCVRGAAESRRYRLLLLRTRRRCLRDPEPERSYLRGRVLRPFVLVTGPQLGISTSHSLPRMACSSSILGYWPFLFPNTYAGYILIPSLQFLLGSFRICPHQRGRGSWKSGHSRGGCVNSILQISSKCGQWEGEGKKPKILWT